MAPIIDGTKEELQQMIQKLERRIHDLEQKMDGKKPADPKEGMRMILIGPPGAGR